MIESKHQTVVIKLFGGPGAGKSTLAHGVVAELKRRGHSVEMAAEFAKDLAWSGHAIGPFDDWVILGHQVERESRLYGKVDFIVTDSPLGLQGCFERMYKPGNGQPLWRAARAIRKLQDQLGIRRLQFLVPRCYSYVPEGRYETEAQAIELDRIVQEYLGPSALQASKVSDVLAALWDWKP